ncbi:MULTISPECIES: hypothetical protein [unclassified Brevundimonas]|uniref:hypothetical protein n=1 Tax=unclassified Brevundimonas TaxID=2622653 RepID=UPI0025BCD54F|nr:MULTISPECIES: hypothetical protein [unclassified Brevundimonas]
MLPEQVRVMSESGAPRYALFFHLDCRSGPVRAWTGFGDYLVAPDEVDRMGGLYQGIGLVGDIPALRQLIGGTAERVDFTLNGTDDRTLRLADRDVDEVRDASVHVGIVFFDADWQAVDTVSWLWQGHADVPSVNRSSDGGEVVRRVTLSVGTAFTDRTRPALSYYTDADQRRRSPDDAFCARVAAYTVESTIVWPGN